MPVQETLLREGRVLLYVYSDPLSMDEVIESLERVNREIMGRASAPIHAICDCTGLTKLPKNALRGSIALTKRIHPMSGTSVVVAENMFVVALSDTIGKVTHSTRLLVRRTLDEAWAEIDGILAAEANAS